MNPLNNQDKSKVNNFNIFKTWLDQVIYNDNGEFNPFEADEAAAIGWNGCKHQVIEIIKKYMSTREVISPGGRSSWREMAINNPNDLIKEIHETL